jgi:hypothetical protein
MNLNDLDEFFNGDKFKLPASRGSDFSQCWTPKEVGTYMARILPPHQEKCPTGVGLSIIHWGIGKGSVQCKRMDPQYHAIRAAMSGAEPCLPCRLFDWFVKNEGANKVMQELRNNIRPQKIIYLPAFLPKVMGWDGKIPMIDWNDGPTTVVWQVTQYTLQKSMETILKSNETLSDPMRGKFIIINITNQKAEKKYPSPDFWPMMGGEPIHPNPNAIAAILNDLYPDVVKVANSGKKTDEEIMKLMQSNTDLRPYLN